MRTCLPDGTRCGLGRAFRMGRAAGADAPSRELKAVGSAGAVPEGEAAASFPEKSGKFPQKSGERPRMGKKLAQRCANRRIPVVMSRAMNNFR